MSKITSHIDVRNELIKELIKELEGPHLNKNGISIIDEKPSWRYITATLHPRKVRIETEEIEDLSAGDASDQDDNQSFSMSQDTSTQFLPNSMGLTFFTKIEDFSNIEIIFKFGIYITQEGNRNSNEKYQLIPFKAKTSLKNISLNKKDTLSEYNLEFEYNYEPFNLSNEIANSIESYIKIRGSLMVNISEHRDYIMYHISVSNSNKYSRATESKLFHCKLTIESNDKKNIFVDRRVWAQGEVIDEEEATIRFLTRNIPEFAVGHGVSPMWKSKAKEVTNKIWSEFVPIIDIPLTIQNPEAFPKSKEEKIDDKKLSIRMEYLSNEKLDPKKLYLLIEYYKKWKNELRNSIDKFDKKTRPIASSILEDIDNAINRIEMGITFLINDNNALTAFKLMNKAMFMVRKSIDDRENPEWRPFQLAFILYCIESTANPSSVDREIMDLLWFPTGGGKTAAYLGIIAFISIYRRLPKSHQENWDATGAGTVTITRYTLRLLTLQQFQRTTKLICSLDLLRRQNPILGDREFSIGLWVGNRSTPRTIRDAFRSLNASNNEASIRQFTVCPWCDTEMDDNESYDQFFEYENISNPKIKCLNVNCEFHNGIPAYLTDEQLYSQNPTVVIGTVDKFARIPKEEDSGSLFGVGTIFRPPDLIIQDELHLIDGPLGTMFGLYESMIHGIISDVGRSFKPKLISSTATIRKAQKLINILFAQESTIFPPTGFEVGDTHWSKIASNNNNKTRTYIGVYAHGKSPKTVFIRIQSLIFTKIKQLRENNLDNEEIIDKYWTLVGFFNSLRELGSANMLVRDDIPSRLQSLSKLFDIEPRNLENTKEMTSRLNSEEVRKRLGELEIELGNNLCLDSLYATNMISVGVDVDRLSLMHVVGQPRTTAEYIQATARVGRKFPGLVTTQYRWNMPRDRSHYERFPYFHQTMNSLVDPLSATPFSLPARERALHAIIIGLFRHGLNHQLERNASEVNQIEQEIIQNYLLNWIQGVETESLDLNFNQIPEMIDLIFEEWYNYKEDYNENLYYTRRDNRGRYGRLMVSMDSNASINYYPHRTPNSLRTVENYARFSITNIRDE